MKKFLKQTIIFGLTTALLVLTGCGAGNTGSDGSSANTASGSAAETASVDLSGQSLMVYCGAGMKDPFTDIAKNFEQETGATVELTFGNAANIISQITTSNQGDLFIAGAETELKSLKEQNYITDSKQLVKHIPVVAAAEGNPKKIASIADLGRDDVTLVLGDAEATPIGKIADAVLADANLTDSASILARTTTAPEMVTALQSGEADAAIVWKENAADKEQIEIVDIADMDKYIKVIPAASLSCSDTEHAEALEAFLDYLDTEKAQSVWVSYGYELVQ